MSRDESQDVEGAVLDTELGPQAIMKFPPAIPVGCISLSDASPSVRSEALQLWRSHSGTLSLILIWTVRKTMR